MPSPLRKFRGDLIMRQSRGGLGMSMIVSVLIHGLLLVLLPMDWMKGADVRVYFLEDYGALQASIIQESPPAQVSVQQPKQAPAKVVKAEPAPKPEPEKPAPPPKPVEKAKVEPKPTLPKEEVKPVPEKPKEATKPVETVKEPPTPIQEKPPVTSVPVQNKGPDEVVTTANPSSPVTIPTSSQESKAVTSAPEVNVPAEDAKVAETTESNEPKKETAPPVVADEGPTEIRVPGGQMLLGHTPPVYPKYAQSDEFEGLVGLEIKVKADGSIQEVSVLQSSGHSRLDSISCETILRAWSFKPHVEPYTIRVNIEFKLGSPWGKVEMDDVVLKAKK